MAYRRIDQRIKAQYLSSYVAAQDMQQRLGANATKGNRTRPLHSPDHKKVQFGDWRMNSNEIYKKRRMDQEISQVAQASLEEVPRNLFINVPHIQSLLFQSRNITREENRLRGQASNHKVKDVTIKEFTNPDKLELFGRIFTEVLSQYRVYVVAEFVRQETRWIDALAICTKGIWEHRDPCRRDLFKNLAVDQELPADICLSKCPKGDYKAFSACHEAILKHAAPVCKNAVLRGLLRCSSTPGSFWNMAMNLVLQIPVVNAYVKAGKMSPALSKGRESSHRKTDRRAETFALLIANMGKERKSKVLDVMDFIDDHFPEMRRNSSIWTSYFNSHACEWKECVKVYSSNLVHYHVDCDTQIFNALIQRCVDAGAMEVARQLHKAMRSKGVAETVLLDKK
ncbi:GTPase [Perkinsela sp. CCAP 1560/4]|nr:GTPase [Perkinsela sp. CCAP 1560/4]|eukprot:KNH06534.1 GTPase [Perkinsela sp. CCAP 1560/4]